MIEAVIGLCAGLWIGVIGACAAYRNGVVDGARNQWLPKVAAILSDEDTPA